MGTDPNMADSDGDGMPDGWEIVHGLDPLNPVDALTFSTDGNGLTNLACYRNSQTDTDGDGIPDWWELAHGLNPFNPADASAVGTDGKTNLERFQAWKANGGMEAEDTDGDGVNDAMELRLYRDPLIGAVDDSSNLTGIRILTPLE